MAEVARPPYAIVEPLNFVRVAVEVGDAVLPQKRRVTAIAAMLVGYVNGPMPGDCAEQSDGYR